MTGFNVRRAALLGGLSVMALSAAPALAQTSPTPAATSSDQATDEGDIVVTAQKRSETLQNVPLSVQAFTGADLERAGTNDINKLVDLVPGASIVSNSAPGFGTIQIRGVSAGTVGDATTGYYIDDVIFSIPNLQLAPPSGLFDLERTEVLRGPQGTLYGNGSMGGLVRLITAAPDTNNFSIRGQGDVSFTENGGTNYGGDGVLNVPLKSDVAGLRISGGYHFLSGFAEAADRPGEQDLNPVTSWNIRGKLLLKPTDNLDVTLSIWHMDDRQLYNNVLNTVTPPVLPNSYGTNPYNRVVATFYSGSINFDLGGVSLQSGTSYLNHDLNFDTTVHTAAIDLRATADFTSYSFSQELRLVSDNASPFRWLVGGLYTRARIASQFNYTVPVPIAPGTTLFLPLIDQPTAPLRTENFAVFGEASYELFDGKLIPLVGLRYFNDRRSAAGTTTIYPTLTPPGITIASAGARTFDAVSPRFNLTYKPTSDATIYFNAARGFRSGSIQTIGQVLFAATDGVTTDTVINPDALWSYEVGAKLRLFDRRLTIEGALYLTDWSNIQLPFTTSAGLVATVNGGDARLKGIDLGVTWRTPVHGLSLQFAGNINESKFTRVDAGLAARLPTARPGQRLPNVPNGNFTIAGIYTAPIGQDTTLNLYAAYSYRDRQSDLASGLFSANLDQLSLRAGVDWRSFKISVFADNLLDERGPLLNTAAGVQAVYPRRIGVSVGFRY